MHPDEKIRNIHERVKYLKRDRKLEAGYMTMEEYIREEAERRAKLMAPSIAESMAETLAKPPLEFLPCGLTWQQWFSLDFTDISAWPERTLSRI